MNNSIGAGYAELYVNGGYYAAPPLGGPTTYSSLAPGTVYVVGYEPSCLGVTIDYLLNGSFQQTFQNPGCDANTGNITTSNGNTYAFYVYGGL